MRRVRPGDIVLHLTDNKGFTGKSEVAEAADDAFVGIEGTPWAGQPAYRIELHNFEALVPELPREAFLAGSEFEAALRSLLEGPEGKGLFFNRDLDLNQGVYLTEAPPGLLAILNMAYQRVAGRPLVDGFAAPAPTPLKPNVMNTNHSLNSIFFGPPGTGKTFVTARRAVEICDGSFGGTDGDVRKRYEELVRQRRIEFVTFHQTYGYEEFVEGLRPEAVLKRHQKITADHGGVTANNVMRHFRSVFNMTAAGFDVFPPNPVNILTQARAWYPERRRRTLIAPHELPAWWAAVMEEADHSRDFLLIALFTGMRRNEVASLRWEFIDFDQQALHLPKTKNGDPLDLPLPQFLLELLAARRTATGASPWVFPSPSKRGHIVETKKFTDRVTARSGIEFTLHDLRRTFITIAESLDISHYALKRMLNHRLSGDVTAGYIVSDIERLRRPVCAVADRILDLSEIRAPNPRIGTEPESKM